jgi:2-polyprenyl-3-methyl-5-hydroxy-6-metoxy-1,4-benzoquinol methylase
VDKQFITNYLHSLELIAFKNSDQFWAHLECRHEEEILDQLDQAFYDREEGINEDTLYVVKNQNLRLSLDVANVSADLYQNYFTWFFGRKGGIEPQKILDVGCDNGIAACFYAKLFPYAEVIGIDIQENAIKCATELADKLGIQNITFLQLDLKDAMKQLLPNSFDLITSLRSFHEIFGEFPEPPKHLSNDQVHFLSLIKKLLRDQTSEFISMERLQGFHSLVMWANALEKADLHIKWGESQYVDFHELGIEQRMPTFVSSGQRTEMGILEGARSITLQY